MKFIHTADLHLGARSSSKLPPAKAEQRRLEQEETFTAIAELAEREGAAVLIAGDVFDTATPPRRTVTAFLDTVRLHAGTRFFCLPGNHDGGSFPTDALPENLTVFGADWECTSLGDTDIYGIAPSGDIPYDGLCPDPARHNIVLLHGAVRAGGTPEPGAVVLSRLAGRGIDYLALGHYHSVQTGALDGRGVWAYSGTPEGRGMDEADGGYVLTVDTAEAPVAPRKHRVARRLIHRLSVDITGTEGRTPEILERVTRAVADLSREDIVRIELTGKLPPETPAPDTDRLGAHLAPSFFFAEVKDKTGLLLDTAALRESRTLKGEFMRKVMAAELSEEERAAILRMGLAALRGEGDEI